MDEDLEMLADCCRIAVGMRMSLEVIVGGDPKLYELAHVMISIYQNKGNSLTVAPENGSTIWWITTLYYS